MHCQRRVIDLASREDWESELSDIPHAYGHTWDSCRAMSLTTAAPTYLYTWRSDRGRVVCPVSERSFRGETDIYSPYGFGGFVGVGDWTGLRDDWTSFVADAGYVCGFLTVNPLLPGPAKLFEEDMHVYNDLYVLDLRLSEDTLYDRLSENRRRQLRRFADLPVQLVDDRAACARFLLANVAPFYAEKGASSAYRFSPETLELLVNSPNSLLLGAEAGDKLQSVAFFLYTRHVAEYFVAVSVNEGRAYTAPLLWHAAQKLRRRGIPLLNLGVGVTRADGIAEFKHRFGADRVPLAALRQVYRPEMFAALCAATGADATDRTGYFPAYRRTRSVEPTDTADVR